MLLFRILQAIAALTIPRHSWPFVMRAKAPAEYTPELQTGSIQRDTSTHLPSSKSL